MASRSVEAVKSSGNNIIRGINRLDIPRLKLPCKSLSDTGDSIDVDKGDTIKKPLEDKAPVSQFSNVIDTLNNDDGGLSPTTQHNLNILLRDVNHGDAKIAEETDGRMQVQYKPVKKIVLDGSKSHIISQPESDIEIKRKRVLDGSKATLISQPESDKDIQRKTVLDCSQANIISEPKSDIDTKLQVKICLEHVDNIKRDKQPAGVLLDSTKISVSGVKKHYRLEHEFYKTGRVLGRGNMAGEIIVLKDAKTGKEHAQKTIMFSWFRRDEIECWVDLNDTGYVPHLYMFTIDGNQMSVHMEILENAGNAMVQKVSHKKLAVKILDFGQARRLDCMENGFDYKGFKSDISEVLRIFSALYTGGFEFNDAYDIQQNWKEKIHSWFEMVGLKNGEKEELSCLVEAAMRLVHPDDVSEFRQQVKEKLNEAMNEEEDKVLEKIVQLLFPEEFQPSHSSTVECVTNLPDL